MLSTKLNLSILSIIFLLVSCGVGSETVCSDTTPSPKMKIEFYTDSLNIETGKLDTFTYILPDALTITGVGVSEPFISSQKNLSSVSIPLDITKNNSDFVFTFTPLDGPQIEDMLYTTYSINTEFLSPECGFFNTYHNLTTEITNTRFKNSIQLNNEITNETNTVLYIYF